MAVQNSNHFEEHGKTAELEFHISYLFHLPASCNWSLLCQDANALLLVPGLKCQLKLEWKNFPPQKVCRTHMHT